MELLDRTITYDTIDVPCYSGDGEVTAYQILVRNPTHIDKPIRGSFVGRWEIELEVISEQRNNQTKHIDVIGGEVMHILKPTPNTSPLTGNEEFQISGVRLAGHRYIYEESGEGSYINRLLLRLSFLITQINNN